MVVLVSRRVWIVCNDLRCFRFALGPPPISAIFCVPPSLSLTVRAFVSLIVSSQDASSPSGIYAVWPGSTIYLHKYSLSLTRRSQQRSTRVCRHRQLVSVLSVSACLHHSLQDPRLENPSASASMSYTAPDVLRISDLASLMRLREDHCLSRPLESRSGHGGGGDDHERGPREPWGCICIMIRIYCGRRASSDAMGPWCPSPSCPVLSLLSSQQASVRASRAVAGGVQPEEAHRCENA
ncbi:hypothetical protein FKP32DRAFT_915718 [Trametes sanguinea]|nr:hypothetical protein FKP32DRAFT_915718 [Trametes sanguinea]